MNTLRHIVEDEIHEWDDLPLDWYKIESVETKQTQSGAIFHFSNGSGEQFSVWAPETLRGYDSSPSANYILAMEKIPTLSFQDSRVYLIKKNDWIRCFCYCM